jgi:hypothetical protein
VAALAADPAQADLGDFIVNLLQPGPRMTMEINSPRQRLSLRVTGSVTFTNTDDDVESVKGKMVLEERRDFKTSRMVFEADGKGGVKRSFSVDGQSRPVDAEARRWLAGVIPAVLRETAIDSDKRAKRVHAKGGADAVIDEIARIESGYARARYINSLIMLGALGDEQLRRTAQLIRAINSDYERRTALVALAEGQPAGMVLQLEVLAVVAVMQSGYEQRTVLVAMAPRLLPDPAIAKGWQAAISKIASDYEARTVIEALAQRDSLPLGQLDVAIGSTLALNSDFEHAVALKALLRHLDSAGPVQLAAFLKSTQRIGSDFERRNVLVQAVEKLKLDRNGFAAVMQAVSGMDSDFEIGTVLQAIATRMPADTELVASYRKLARRLGDHERGQAERALDRPNA